MERGKKTNFILRQFKRKTKQIVRKDFFTEFFYINRERRVIEFLPLDEILAIEHFFKEFLPTEFRDFIEIKILNDVEEEINTWYFDNENLVLLIKINWGFKKQEISIDIAIENFIVTAIDENNQILRDVDYVLLNDYFISFLTIQARSLAETYKKLHNKSKTKK